MCAWPAPGRGRVGCYYGGVGVCGVAVVQASFLLDGPDLVRTGISPRYVPGWGMVEALREVLQEYVDVRRQHGCSGRVRWAKGRVVVEDDGPGLPREALALGVSGKREDDRLIGQFGEGLKLACLVAAREGRHMEVETVGFSVVPRLVRDPFLGCEVLAFGVRENSRLRGTRVEVEATREEYLAARRCFLEFGAGDLRVLWREEGEPRVMLPAGRVYVNGCLAQERDDLIFSYNLPGLKGAQNRDRTVLDEYQLRDAVRPLLGRARSVRVAEEALRTVECGLDRLRLEHGWWIHLSGRALPAWRRAFRRIFGSKVALADHGPTDEELRVTYGYRVLERYPYPWREMLGELGAYGSRQVLARLCQRSGRRVALSPGESEVLEWACQVVRRRVADPGRVEVVERLVAGDAEVDGHWDPGRRVIRLARRVLSDPVSALGTLVHEVLHKKSGAHDCTRQFEGAWEELAVRLILGLEGVVAGPGAARGGAGASPEGE